MKVDISVAGVFHSYHLAYQLYKHGMLGKLICSYPRSYLRNKFDIEIPSENFSGNYIQYLKYFLKYAHIRNNRLNSKLNDLHDILASHALSSDLDIVVGWSGNSLRTLNAAKKINVRTIIVRGSAHIVEQSRILRDEYDSMGMGFNLCQDVIKKEIDEYEVADYVQTNSSFAASTFIKMGVPEEKIIMCNTGVDLTQFKQIKKEDNVFRIITAGTLSIRKGSYYLLKAFTELDIPDAELWHIGAVHPEMNKILRKYDHKNIKYLGYKPYSELYKYYSQGSVFLFPSLEEGLAVVQAQAMACGLPIICTTNSGGADFLTKNRKEGFIIPVCDTEQIKEKIWYLYSNRDKCIEMGGNAKERISKGYTWDDYGLKIVNKYKKLIER